MPGDIAQYSSCGLGRDALDSTRSRGSLQRDRTLAVHTVPIGLYISTVWTCRRSWWRGLRVAGVRLYGLVTLLVFLTLLMVSGPHRVHHFTEQHPPGHHHTQEGQHTQDDHAPALPDCPVFFLLQHTPVAESGLAFFLTLLCVTESIRSTTTLGKAEAPQYVSQARAPPPILL